MADFLETADSHARAEIAVVKQDMRDFAMKARLFESMERRISSLESRLNKLLQWFALRCEWDQDEMEYVCELLKGDE